MKHIKYAFQRLWAWLFGWALIKVPAGSMVREWGQPLIRHVGQGRNGWDYYYVDQKEVEHGQNYDEKN